MLSIFRYGMLPVILLFFVTGITAQPLLKGQRIPDPELKNVINHSEPTIRLSDYKGKLIILDFWGLTCRACIEAFPKLDSLQKKYKDKLQIILVNAEGKDATEQFFVKRKRIKKPDVPLITGDSILINYFPHNFVPWHVWIDSAGIVTHITHGYNATEKNIEAYLGGKNEIRSELQYVANFDPRKPLIAEDNGRWLDKVEYYSYIMRCIPGAPAGHGISSSIGDIEPNRITRNCSSIRTLFVSAYEEGNKYNFQPRNTVIFQIKDTFNYMEPGDYDLFDVWQSANSYNYDLMLPPSKATDLYKMMQQDITRYFDLSAKVEKRKIKSMVLVRTSSKDKIKSKGGEAFSRTTETSLQIKNRPIGDLVWTLQYKLEANNFQAPLINATGYLSNIDITISAEAIDLINITALRKELKKYDLDLVEKYWLTEVLVIKKIKRL